MAFGGGGGGGRGRKALAEINIVPLVDIMLVLLIIFMVTAPLIQTGVKVELPAARAPAIDAEEQKLVLAITKDQRIFLADTEIPMAELGTKLATNAKLKQDKELYIHADRTLPYGLVVEIMALAREAGIDSLGMVTDPVEVREARR